MNTQTDVTMVTAEARHGGTCENLKKKTKKLDDDGGLSQFLEVFQRFSVSILGDRFPTMTNEFFNWYCLEYLYLNV